MSFLDNDADREALNQRIDLLLKMQQTGLEERLITVFLAELTPAEKKALKAKLLARLHVLIEKELEKQVPELVRREAAELARNNAFVILKERWTATWAPKMREQVEATLMASLTPEVLGSAIEENVLAFRRQAVHIIVTEAIAKVRAAVTSVKI